MLRAAASSRLAEPRLRRPRFARRAGTDLSVALRAPGRAVPARRRGRQRRPHHRRPPRRDVGPADGDREQGRRGRQHRRAGGAAGRKRTATRSTSARSATRSTSSSIPSLGYNPVADFAPVTLMCVYPNILAVPNSSPDHSVPDFIARAKADPGKVTYASSGVGTSLHLAGELFKRMAGVNLTHIPYRGAGPALNDLIPGRVDAIFANFPSTLPYVQQGQLRGLAVTTAQAPARSAATCRRSPSSCRATMCRRGSRCSSPRKRRPKSSRSCIRMRSRRSHHPPVKARYAQLGATVVASTPAELAAHLKSEMDRWGPVIKAAGIRADG